MDEDNDPMSSESDSDDSDDLNLKVANEQVLAFKKQIEANELDYEAHLGLIKTLRSMNELEEVRNARQSMNKIYPLSPDLWMEWLEDERKICTTDEERLFIIDLFNKSVKEYMSVKLWVEYIMFMVGGGKIEETRKVYEEALTDVGIHVGEGVLVWQTIILVESQVFLSLTAEDTKAIEEQRKVVQNLYKRQARVPLMNMDVNEFCEEAFKWFEDSLDPQLKQDVNNSHKNMLKKFPFECALLQAKDDREKLEAYREYMDSVRKSENPSVIKNLYERIIADFCLNVGMWEEYVRFVMEQFTFADYVILPVCERSQLNCPWSSSLFELRITAIQMFEETLGHEEVMRQIKEALTKTLKSGVVNEVELLKIWMAYLVYLRRGIPWGREDADQRLAAFREACAQAIDFIDKKLGEEGDRECTIARFQSRVEAELARDMEAARVLWNQHVFMRNNNFKLSPLWLEYLNLERSYGTEKHCRKLYRRALERVWDGVEVIGSSYLQFEQEIGTLETMADFEKRYRDRLSIVLKKRAEETQREEGKRGPGEKGGKVKGRQGGERNTTVTTVTTVTKIYPVKKSPEKRPAEKHQSTAEPKGQKRSLDDEDMPPPGYKKDLDAPPPGYKKPEETERENKRQKVSDHGEFIEHDPSLDHRSVFLSNMDYNASEAEVRGVFSGCGAIENFRPVKDFKGRSKGFGYLLFREASSVAPALLKDRTPVGTRPLFVSPCNAKNREHAFKFSTGLEREKLFVKGLPFSLDERQVREAFEPHGAIKSLRLVTHRNGHSKGTCYIEYHDAETAAKVLGAMHGTELEGHTISVFVSNPTAAKAQRKAEAPPTPTPTVARADRQRPKLSFMPRALLRKPDQAPNPPPSTSSNGAQNGSQKSKTNEEFRKMFLK